MGGIGDEGVRRKTKERTWTRSGPQMRSDELRRVGGSKESWAWRGLGGMKDEGGWASTGSSFSAARVFAGPRPTDCVTTMKLLLEGR